MKGFTIFFAVLVSSLSLAIGLAIYDLTVREIDLSSTATQSQYAVYAADSGTECALYWDSRYGGAGSAFATSSTGTGAPSGSSLWCGQIDISVTGPPAADAGRYPGCTTSPWCVNSTASSATTTFSVTFVPQPYCAVVEVGKYTDGAGVIYTTVFSRGYNTCTAGGPVRLERTLQVNY